MLTFRNQNNNQQQNLNNQALGLLVLCPPVFWGHVD